ncbi:MAG: hypothetical protein DBX55_04455 [Verrucomicrobia bacterium]|nr:MAG: hypothetical protein DBX55_04455 [Verrucomicrobiota bacterium]
MFEAGRAVGKAVLAAFGVCMAASCAFAIRANDFTRANSVFKSRYKSEKSSISDKVWSGSQLRADSKAYEPPARTSGLSDLRADMGGSGEAKRMGLADFSGSDKRYDSPELSGMNGAWSQADSQWKPKNGERDFTKKYSGRIDFSKRGKYVDYLKEAYADMNERSMQDINKYQFRRSHSSDPGVKTTEAGAQLRDDDSSFFDLLLDGSDTERAPVKFYGPKNRNAIKREAAADAENSGADRAAQPANPTAAPPPNARFMPALIRTQSGAARKEDESSNSSKKTVAEKEIDGEKAKNFRFMKMPDNMRGKATIKVEVETGDF